VTVYLHTCDYLLTDMLDYELTRQSNIQIILRRSCSVGTFSWLLHSMPTRSVSQRSNNCKDTKDS